MSKETPADDPRQKTDGGSLKQTDKPWKGAAGEGTEAERSHAGSRKVAGNPYALMERDDVGKQTGRRQRAQGRGQEAHPS